MLNPLTTLFAGPLARIILRYGIGFAAGKGLLPDGLAEMITDSEPAIDAINTGICVLAGGCVERLYYLAKKFGKPL